MTEAQEYLIQEFDAYPLRNLRTNPASRRLIDLIDDHELDCSLCVSQEPMEYRENYYAHVCDSWGIQLWETEAERDLGRAHP